MGEENQRKIYSAISFVVASAAALLWMSIAESLHQAQVLAQVKADVAGSASHITRYIVCLLIFTAVFMGCNVLLKKIKFVWKDAHTWHLVSLLLPVSALIFAIACVPFMKTMLGTEYEQYVDLRVKYMIVAGGIFAVAAWYWFQKHPLRPISARAAKTLFIVGVVIAVAAAAWTCYAPNSLRSTTDYEAYWSSTFSLVRGIPVDGITAGFYGHYGMLQAPFFWLVGGFTPYTCAALTAIEASVIMLAMCYVISCVTDRLWLRYLGIGMLLFRVMKQTMTYAQAFPHRFVFEALLLAFGAWFLKRIDTRGNRFFVSGIVGGYALATLGAIWSNDVGLFILMAWGVLHAYCLMTRRTQPKKALLHLATAAASTVGSLGCAWGVTSLLNIVIWKGSALSFRLFLFPLFETVQENIFEAGALPLIAPWVPAFVFLLYYAAQGMAHLFVLPNAPQKRFDTDIAFFSAIMGLGVLLYFFSRATYGNFYICYLPLVVCMLVAAQRFCAFRTPQQQTATQQLVHSVKRGAWLVSIVIPACLCAAMVAELPINIAATRRDQAMDGVEAIKAQMLAQFPQGTAVYGWNATYYNALLNAPTENIIWVPGNNIWFMDLKEVERRRKQAPGPIALSSDCWGYTDYFVKIDMDDWAKRYENAQTVELNYQNEAMPEASQSIAFYAFSPKAESAR